MSRKKFSKKDLRELLQKFNEKCRMCQCDIDGASGLEWDHRIPLAIGGDDALDNLEPLCIRCHRTKTKGDQATIAKTRRQRDRNQGIRKPTRKIQYLKAEKPVRDRLPIPPRRSVYDAAS